MRPLEPIEAESRIAALLRGAPPRDVQAELEALDGRALSGAAAAARAFAHGALALRTGRLDAAFERLDEAARGFEASGESEAAALARAEAWLAAIRRGPRKVYADAIEALAEIASGARARVFVVATHYRATALRYSGRAEETLRTLLEAFAASDGLLAERAQVLNSLGTLYGVMGAYGAAQAVLEHAADVSHRIGDRASEAISYGQLGSAALARGAHDEARRHLQRQEWLASQLGDTFGQARALVLLADLAIDAGRADDAIELAEQARRLAESVAPPLEMWLAYAARTAGRARLELEADGSSSLAEAAERFAKLGNQLGEALVGWDRLRHDGGEPRRWFEVAWQLATLGLTQRVARLLVDVWAGQSDSEERRALDLAIAATAQSYPQLATAREVDLVLTDPDAVAAVATRRIGGQRNLGRLAALALSRDGLFAAAIAAGAIGRGAAAVPSGRAGAVVLGQLPGAVAWAWPGATDATLVARDLSSLRVALGDDMRAALGYFAEGRIRGLPMAGELAVEVAGVDLEVLVAHALADPPGSLRRILPMPWSREAEAIARMSGLSPV